MVTMKIDRSSLREFKNVSEIGALIPLAPCITPPKKADRYNNLVRRILRQSPNRSSEAKADIE